MPNQRTLAVPQTQAVTNLKEDWNYAADLESGILAPERPFAKSSAMQYVRTGVRGVPGLGEAARVTGVSNWPWFPGRDVLPPLGSHMGLPLIMQPGCQSEKVEGTLTLHISYWPLKINGLGEGSVRQIPRRASRACQGHTKGNNLPQIDQLCGFVLGSSKKFSYYCSAKMRIVPAVGPRARALKMSCNVSSATACG